ncbi:MAG TPA: multidrug ABC transporter ATP-binding protein [Bacteroidetes bacterium]|nr:MAG: multidrug ABC transporter ATP-binding protein [Ignavibacteria bacterium GWA2_54_16]HCA78210.1 multidrug ABC transporter ATP-binding protein [Bacteroidota bacterium]
MSVIRLTSVSKSFGSLRAVDDISLEVNKGEMVALVGADGAGKTTTIRMLCGIVAADSGDISVCGYDIRKQGSEAKNRIGYLSQRFSLYPDLTIDENIEFFAEIHQVAEFRERREQLLEFTRLTPFRSRFAENLSGGMKQKLALACTLIHTPEVIFLDEPTAGVDPVSRRDFWKILSSLLKTGITIFMTTPYLDEAERCSRVAMMNEGRILVADTPQNLKALMKGVLIELVCPDIRSAFALLKAEGVCKEVQAFGDRLNIVVENETKGLKKVRDLLKVNSIIVSDHRVITPSLENVFISLLSEGPVTKEQMEGVGK